MFYSSTYCADDGSLHKRVRVYNIFKDKDLLGQYLRSGSQHRYTFGGNYVKITSGAKWYKKPDFKIIDQHTNEVIGSFIIPTYFNDNYYHYPEAAYSNPYMKVILHGAEYTFGLERPEVEYWLFDKNTWGYYAFSLYDTQGINLAAYTFKVEHPLLNNTISAFCTFEGDIKAGENNIHILFAGLFLLEQLIDTWARNA